jgi:hypothetical protein
MNDHGRHPLSDSLLSRRWLRRSHPFVHIVAYDVFVPGVYEALSARFREVVGTLGGHSYLDGHDIFGTTVTPESAGGLHPLSSRAWHDLLASLAGVRATGHLALGMHHHKVGSADGFPHNDLNVGWFAGDPEPTAVELSRPDAVEYTTGIARRAGVVPRETVRAVAAIFYLANGPWQPGDGGSTGLYRRATDPVRRPAVVVPPIDNSLLVFECTPTSWHGFISNRRRPRNSIIMWLHRPKAEVIARWGAEAIVPYGRRPSPEAGR